ncbi:E3 ubiquitin/ISG15 ligase TRIM25-like [Trichomycterus rosablanca]|uniref:E3 ubiquitin/ISG15 ligase TRIM25-like n=1 Tax=Trichomycterus rosablanca TaxID=2290929 RepID=UPI002F355684
MAEAAKSFYVDHFCCPVCLEVLKDPVTIPCGHTYCMDCISNVWADVDQNGVYSCPQCREAFSSKPALNKNIIFAEMIEKLKITSDQTTHEKQYSSEVVNLECDSCTGTKNPAVKFCLQCLASFCELHLQPHFESPAFMKHTLVQASSQMQKNICQHHVRLLDIYCHDDHQCICYMCMLDSHKDHKTSSVESERIKNQKTLEGTKTQWQQMIDQREEGLQELSRAVTSFKSFTQAAEDDTERILTELMSFIKERFSKVKELIKTHERRELSRADELRFRINQELTDLRTNTAGIEELLATTDDIVFMRKYNLLQAFPAYKDLSSITYHPCESSGTISLSAQGVCILYLFSYEHLCCAASRAEDQRRFSALFL